MVAAADLVSTQQPHATLWLAAAAVVVLARIPLPVAALPVLVVWRSIRDHPVRPVTAVRATPARAVALALAALVALAVAVVAAVPLVVQAVGLGS